ncbi:MAG: hypothetical protein JXQ90_03960 [Cyclobacteriaceae bacterium]
MQRHYRLILGLLMVGCTEFEPATPQESGIGFFPVDAALYRVYDVYDIQYEISGFDTSTYQLREQIVDSISSDAGVSYVIQQEVRSDNSEAWTVSKLLSIRRNNINAVLVEDNFPLVKLAFPVREGVTWDLNSMNTDETSMSTYSNSDYTNNIIEGLEVIDVTISDLQGNIVREEFKKETYADGVGLVAKTFLVYEFCQTGCDSAGQINTGFFVNQELIEYGYR